jgi:hypothetical protein
MTNPIHEPLSVRAFRRAKSRVCESESRAPNGLRPTSDKATAVPCAIKKQSAVLN